MRHQKRHPFTVQRLRSIQHARLAEHHPYLAFHATTLQTLEAEPEVRRLIHRIRIRTHQRQPLRIRHAHVLHRLRIAHNRIHDVSQRLIPTQRIHYRSVQRLVASIHWGTRPQPSLHRPPRHQVNLVRKHIVGLHRLLDPLPHQLADKQNRQQQHQRKRQCRCRHLKLCLQPHLYSVAAAALEYSFNLFCSVFELIPNISAAFVLLLCVECSVFKINCRSASSTVVPTSTRTEFDSSRYRCTSLDGKPDCTAGRKPEPSALAALVGGGANPGSPK